LSDKMRATGMGRTLNGLPDKRLLPPGSKQAVEEGCRCPVLDNNHGRGIPVTGADGKRSTMFWRNDECPIHGRSA